MNNVIKFKRPEPQKPEKKPAGPRGLPQHLTWQPWAIFAALVVVVYVLQYMKPFG